VILLVVLREEFRQVGDGLVRDFTDVEVLQRVDDITTIWGSVGFRWLLVWQPEWKEWAPIDHSVARTLLCSPVGIAVVNHD
jgi:hypothetical protein